MTLSLSYCQALQPLVARKRTVSLRRKPRRRQDDSHRRRAARVVAVDATRTHQAAIVIAVVRVVTRHRHVIGRDRTAMTTVTTRTRRAAAVTTRATIRRVTTTRTTAHVADRARIARGHGVDAATRIRAARAHAVAATHRAVVVRTLVVDADRIHARRAATRAHVHVIVRARAHRADACYHLVPTRASRASSVLDRTRAVCATACARSRSDRVRSCDRTARFRR